jgi:hypothetical protein
MDESCWEGALWRSSWVVFCELEGDRVQAFFPFGARLAGYLALPCQHVARTCGSAARRAGCSQSGAGLHQSLRCCHSYTLNQALRCVHHRTAGLELPWVILKRTQKASASPTSRATSLAPHTVWGDKWLGYKANGMIFSPSLTLLCKARPRHPTRHLYCLCCRCTGTTADGAASMFRVRSHTPVL